MGVLAGCLDDASELVGEQQEPDTLVTLRETISFSDGLDTYRSDSISSPWGNNELVTFYGAGMMLTEQIKYGGLLGIIFEFAGEEDIDYNRGKEDMLENFEDAFELEDGGFDPTEYEEDDFGEQVIEDALEFDTGPDSFEFDEEALEGEAAVGGDPETADASDNHRILYSGADRNTLVVNEIEPTTGSTIVGRDGEWRLLMSAPTHWRVHVASLQYPHPEPPTPPATVTGQGSSITGAVEVAEPVTVTGEFYGDDPVQVRAVEERHGRDELIFTISESGQNIVETEMTLEGQLWFDIDAPRGWSLEFETA
ncbi:hypothetical protein D8Y22_00270 [Salinadaptatus halalkaliphilus]|uniref:Uncharacterized protein n=1 Tax=Salinadaptatus halalkaliphilus TaxID=2419781 RepID=A0A4S3TT27_9EURY|nr:hypothetical protein D8Y22_00270 [Salinadaptatus halalkaliphilus]